MELILSLFQDVLSWAVIGALAWLCIQVKGIVKHTKLMEQSNKSLMYLCVEITQNVINGRKRIEILLQISTSGYSYRLRYIWF